MIKSRYITMITAALVCLALIGCALIVYAAGTTESNNTPEYEKKLFSGDVVSLDIQVDESEWQQLQDNAIAKEYISGNLVVNDELFSTVGIRTKGNSSLSQVASSDSDRYSLQFKFNYYVKGQTYYGLDAFCINNMVGDATYMKDYISYRIMDSVGVPSPLVTYASVTVNGEDLGFYVLLERYDDSFLDRVYNTSGGELYSVKIQMGQRENFEGLQDDQNAIIIQNGQNIPNMPNDQNAPAMPNDPNAESEESTENEDSNRQNGMFAEVAVLGRNGGGSLVYTDDDPSSYSAIFENSVSRTVSDNDKQQVITAIKNLNEGTDLEKYFDVDEILRYFAAHTVVVNLDSYISNMQQNYYIYEKDGKISILPWDYGLSFGGYQGGNASSVVNFPIDTPVSGVSMEDRPLLNKLLEVDEYKERYHSYLNQIVTEYFDSGLFTSDVLSLAAKIDDYVKNDVSSFFTYEQFQTAVPALIELGTLRAESIRGQLDGTVPSTSEGQEENPDALVDSSSVNVSTLGSMGGMAGKAGENPEDGGQMQAFPGNGEGNMFGGMMDMDMSKMRDAMGIISSSTDGELSDEQISQLKELGFDDTEIEQLKQLMQDGFGAFRQGGRPEGGGGQFPGIGGGNGALPDANGTGSASTGFTASDWIVYAALAVIIGGAIIYLSMYRRRKLR